ncbi:MAG: hypothetical protein DLM71_03070 [Chloroflexi bacterium]|nr:MAG: hypothetical protein DLM71_03070 [Chloroflexota bacterium]
MELAGPEVLDGAAATADGVAAPGGSLVCGRAPPTIASATTAIAIEAKTSRLDVEIVSFLVFPPGA